MVHDLIAGTQVPFPLPAANSSSVRSFCAVAGGLGMIGGRLGMLKCQHI